MSLLTIVRNAMGLCRQDRPTVVFSSTDPTVKDFLAISQEAGDAEKDYDAWRKLKVMTGTFTGDGTTTVFDLPSDFDYMMQGYPIWLTDWLKSPAKRVTDEQMMAAKVADVWTNTPVWRMYGDAIEFYPALDSGKEVNFEYRTQNWITSDDGSVARSEWAADSDLSLIPDRVITLSIIWRWKYSKGFTYDEDFRNWQIARSQASFANAARAPIRIGRSVFNTGLGAGVHDDVPPVVP